ncbi:Rho GTPase activation protein [Halteromyces radiatus]|uniref:Rho GTPase activation protein n=1 Tax=Halteromyces radiatus TaxID=101107 RepID=UPI00221EB2AA|nr:Rho GTPase activation protein [Halteromyces radiatus]KAI8084484.1 Rho GTPase activation protein [Halteromyces radiatus]
MDSIDNRPPLKKRKSFRRWIRKVTTPKVSPILPKGVDGKHQGVFGVPLVASISYARATIGYQDADQVNHQRAAAIPLVVAKCGSYLKRNALETEGIFRLSGSTKRVNTLQQIFDSPQASYGLHHVWKDYSVHDAGSILRRYFLRLPDPVIPIHFYQQFRDVMNDSMYEGTSQRIDAFQSLICQLPTAHQHLLLYVLDMLRLFATNASATRMDAANLAAVFSPGLLSHPQHNSPVQYMISQRVIEFLIEFQALFTMDLLVDNETKPVEPDESLVSPNIQTRASSSLSPSTSSSRKINKTPSPPVPTIPSHFTHQEITSASLVQSPLSIRSSSLPLPHQQRGIVNIEKPHTLDISPDQYEKITDEDEDDDIPTPRPGSPIQQYQYHKDDSAPINASFSNWQLNKILASIDYWLKNVFNPLKLVWHLILSTILCTILFEAYMIYGNLAIVEPFLFFSGFVTYWFLLINGMDIQHQQQQEEREDTLVGDDMTGPIQSYRLDDGYSDHVVDDDFDKDSIEHQDGGDGLSLFDDISLAGDQVSEQALMRDKEIMANWQQLMTRAWRAAPDDIDMTVQQQQEEEHPMYPALGNSDNGLLVDDGASMASVSSRFNEDFMDDDDEDDEEDLLSTTDEDLEQLWARYEQFKQDEELAEKLQQEEQVKSLQLKQQRGGNNPFLDDSR